MQAERVLNNGLKVIVQEAHRLPVIVCQLCYLVGSADEPPGLTGVSHALEHMMFKGTTQIPDWGVMMQRMGAQDNAFTNDDYTAYHIEAAVVHLDPIFALEADRMSHLGLNEADFIPEQQVIIEERRLRIEDDPQSLLFEHYRAAANTGPYHHPIIGWMKDIENLTIDDLRAWYKKWYTPDNAILIVLGDVNVDQVFLMAEQHFGSIPRSSMTRIRSMPPPEQIKTERRIKLTLPAVNSLIMGFDIPYKKEAFEPYALALLATALDGGESARFSKYLIREKGLMAMGGIQYDLFKRYSDQFHISGVPSEGVLLPDLEVAIWEAIDNIKKTPLSDQELKKIKIQWMAQFVFEKDSLIENANIIASYEGAGFSWKDSEQFINYIKAVSADQIQMVANRYFIKENLTVAYLEGSNQP